MKKYSLDKFKERRKNKRMLKITIITVIAIFVLVFVALYMANSSFNSFIDTYIFRKKISDKDVNSLTIDTDNLSLIYAYDNSLVVYSDGSINFYNTDAKQTGNIEMTLSKPIADSEGKYLALADYGLQKICLIKSNNLVWQKDIEGKISKVSVNKQGYVAVSVTGTTYESIVMLFNEKGDLLFSKYLSNYVMDIDISEDSKYIAIAEVDNSTILPITKSEIVSIEMASTSAENATVNTYEADSNELLTGMKYQSKNILLCSFENYVLKMTTFSSEKMYEISDLTAYLEVDSKRGFVRIDKKVYIIEGSIKSLVSKDDKIALNLGKEVHFINNNGWLLKRFVGNQEVKSVLVSNNLGIIVFKDRISIVNL